MREIAKFVRGLWVFSLGNLIARIKEAFDSGRENVHILVVKYCGREIVVDYMVIHRKSLVLENLKVMKIYSR